jgi:hypothetical protein
MNVTILGTESLGVRGLSCEAQMVTASLCLTPIPIN